MAPLKPKIARTATARAKGGDLAAKVEVLLQFIGDVASGKERLSFMQLLMAIAMLVAACAVGAGIYLLMRSKVVALSASDSASLKQVFYTGEPWLVECTKGRSASPMVYGAESSLRGVQIGTLDCGALLPSGKTTLERFKLTQPNYGPVLLAAANTERPQIAPRNALTSQTALVSWVQGATKPKLYAPSTAAQFESQCLRKPWCLVVLTATGRLVDAEKKALQGLAERERRLRVVRIDASKASLLLDLPGGALPAPQGTAATLVLVREMEGAASQPAEGEEGEAEGGGRPVMATHLPAGLTDPAETGTTILKALTSSEAVPSGFSQLQKRPALRPKRVPAPSTPKVVTPEQRDSSGTPASKTYSDEELKKLREERQRLLVEAEQQRRKQMAEEESAAANIVEETDEEGGSAPDTSAFAADGDEDGDEGMAADGEEDVEAVDFD